MSAAVSIQSSGATVMLGVLAVDVPFSSVYDFITTKFDPCMTSLVECFAIDGSGFVLVHKDFLVNPPTSAVHITVKEPLVAADMVQSGVMHADSCVSYSDITNQLFWMVDLYATARKLTYSQIFTVSGFDMLVVVKTPQTAGGMTCSCPTANAVGEFQCTAGQQCQCPCYTKTDYSYCSGHFTITNSTKACYPPTLPLYLADLSTAERSRATTLPPCLQCSLLATEKDCTTTGCCWTTSDTDSDGQGICATCYRHQDIAPAGSSCSRTCLGLAIGLTLGLIFIIALVVVIIVFVVWKGRGLEKAPARSAAEQPTDGEHKTIINVTGVELRDSGYITVPDRQPEPIPTTPPPPAEDQHFYHPISNI